MLVLIGASASGKTEIAKILIKKYDFKKLVTYTTREMRDGEINGKDYHFVTEQEFLKMEENNQFMETAVYHQTHYGSPIKGADINKVIIVEPKGANSIYKKHIPDSVFIYLETDALIRRVRMLNRGDSLDNVNNRIKEDKTHFRKTKFKHLDYIVNTSKKTLEELADQIYELYQSHLKGEKMKRRRFGKTNLMLSEIALGTWQLGSKWGDPFDKEVAYNTLDAATLEGINCYDTADVYQGGASEATIGSYIKNLDEKPFVITKTGRQLNPHTAEGYNEENLRMYINQSRERLAVDSLDMVLLHCPPTDVYYNPKVFQTLDQFKEEGIITHYGVSVERVEEAMKAMDYDGVEAIEIIFNMFRLRPLELFFEEAKKRDVAIIVRVPLASGLLTGKFTKDTTFTPGDHRTFNRNGEAFDKGETFSGVDYFLGLQAVEELKKLFNTDNIAPYALRWILMFDAVSIVIPGASKESHIINNAKASELPPLTEHQMNEVKRIYDTYIKDPVHYLW